MSAQCLGHNWWLVSGSFYYSQLTSATIVHSVSTSEPRAPEVTDLCLTGGETEAQRDEVTCPRLHSYVVGLWPPATWELVKQSGKRTGRGVVTPVLGASFRCTGL